MEKIGKWDPGAIFRHFQGAENFIIFTVFSQLTLTIGIFDVIIPLRESGNSFLPSFNQSENLLVFTPLLLFPLSLFLSLNFCGFII